MAAAAVTPIALPNSQVTIGGTAVVAVPANPGGGFIQNPATGEAQGLGVGSMAENLYVSAAGTADTTGNGITFTIPPGGSWEVIAGQTTPTTVNSVSDGHKFAGTYWPNT